MILSNTRVYLCGPLENDPQAAGWRLELARRLPLINPEIIVWDPMIKPDWVSSQAKNDQISFQWKEHVGGGTGHDERGKECHDTNKLIRIMCKQLANKCDWFIARISKTFTWGSIDELEIAITRRIPIFLWLPDGKISIYGLAGCVHNYDCINNYVHYDMESLLDTIDGIDKGKINIMETDPEAWMRMTWKNAAEIKEC